MSAKLTLVRVKVIGMRSAGVGKEQLVWVAMDDRRCFARCSFTFLQPRPRLFHLWRLPPAFGRFEHRPGFAARRASVDVTPFHRFEAIPRETAHARNHCGVFRTTADTWDPTPSSERGLSLSLRQTLGGSSSGGADALLERETLAGLGASKVMKIENDYHKEVYNGDIGLVADVDPEAGELTARFEGRDLVYGFGELDTLVPAYAATVHKSQGSEYAAVVIPVLTQHSRC